MRVSSSDRLKSIRRVKVFNIENYKTMLALFMDSNKPIDDSTFIFRFIKL